MSGSPQKPKPRPRPRPRNVASSTEIDKPELSKSPIQDEDAMFIRNKNRSANSWSKINQVVEKREAARHSSTDLDSSDSDSPRAKRARRRQFTPKAREMPAWAKSDGLMHIQESASESDGDVSVTPESHKVNGSSETTAKATQEKHRSRSPSESPEPQIFLAEQIGRERARQLLGGRTSRGKSPISISEGEGDELDNADELPAELAAIKAEARRNLARAISADNSSSSTATVDLRITLKPHPEDESGKSYIFSHSMKRNEKFEHLFDEIADAGGIASHSIWSEAELVAYEEHVYQYVKNQSRSSPPTNSGVGPAPESSSAVGVEDFAAESDASQDKADTFKLQARSGAMTVTVTVRHTTKCSAIVANVLGKLGKPISAAKKARIEVDGEKLTPDSEIGDADVEDGDLIDIVGV